MDDRTKICPECGAEYYAHVDICKGCDAALVYPGEKTTVKAEGQLVCIMEGDYHRIKEIAYGIKSSGMDCKVLSIGKAGSCSSSDALGIFVQQSLAPEAAKAAERVKSRLYPEIDLADEGILSGQCPACGADVGNSPDECPDCGLNLSGGGADGCGGGCGPC